MFLLFQTFGKIKEDGYKFLFVCLSISCSLVWGECFSLHHQPSRQEFGLPHKELPLRVPLQVSTRAQ